MTPIPNRPSSRPRGALLTVLALGLLLAAGPTARGQAPGPLRVSRTGTEALRSILTQLDLKPLTGLGELENRPSRTLLIVLGQDYRLPWSSGSLQQFVQKGGAILLATDRRSNPVWEDAFAVIVTGARVSTSDAGDRYRSDDDAPALSNYPLAVEAPEASVRLFAGLRAPVATNRPSTLLWPPWDEAGARHKFLAPVARLPRSCVVRQPGRRPPRLHDAFPPVLAVAGEWGSGRILVVADHSIFINEMMLQEDNGNFDFAGNALQWLTTSDDGRTPRDRCLFVEDGQLVSEFPDGLALLPMPSAAQMIRAADGLLLDLQKDNVHNRLLLDLIPLHRLLSVLVVGLTAALALYGLIALLRARHRPVPVVAAPVGVAAVVSPTVFAQRQNALLRRGNVTPLARERARQTLAALGVGASGPPTVTVVGGWRTRRYWEAQVRALWELAHGPQGVPVSLTDWPRWQSALRRLQQATQGGMVRIGPAGGQA